MYSAFKKAGLAAVMAAAAVSMTTPASATVAATDPIQVMASSRCLVGTSGNCTTAVVRANSTGHYVDYLVNNIGRWSPCTWRVRDVNTQVVVRSGTVGTNSRISGRVPGLYGSYQLELRVCTVSATGVIDND